MGEGKAQLHSQGWQRGNKKPAKAGRGVAPGIGFPLRFGIQGTDTNALRKGSRASAILTLRYVARMTGPGSEKKIIFPSSEGEETQIKKPTDLGGLRGRGKL